MARCNWPSVAQCGNKGSPIDCVDDRLITKLQILSFHRAYKIILIGYYFCIPDEAISYRTGNWCRCRVELGEWADGQKMKRAFYLLLVFVDDIADFTER